MAIGTEVVDGIPSRGPELGEQEKKIPLMEIFGPTIQGEGAVIGQQTYFIRFGLCDYKCTMCDSMFAVDPRSVMANGERLVQKEIADKFIDFHKPGSTRWITFSGGNPCIHNLTKLVGILGYHQFKIAVETQGTMCPDWLSLCNVVTISPKGPGMGEKLELDKLDNFIARCNVWAFERPYFSYNIKVVVFDQRDLEVAASIYDRYMQVMGSGQFYLSLGNPFPPGQPGSDTYPLSQHRATLVGNYLRLFEDIQNNPLLSQMKFLPQWHVFLWGNQKGK